MINVYLSIYEFLPLRQRPGVASHGLTAGVDDASLANRNKNLVKGTAVRLGGILSWAVRRQNALLAVAGVALGAGLGLWLIDSLPSIRNAGEPQAEVSDIIIPEPPSDAWRRAPLPQPPAGEARSQAPPREPPRARTIGFCQGRSGDNCVIDGDTFILAGETVRLAGIDAPEMGNARCPAERARAEHAKARLHVLLNAGPIELVANADRNRDRHGRLLRDALVNGTSVSARLIDEGLARPWQGRKADWC
jgi:endonuclease YncB( thermonuclease family)